MNYMLRFISDYFLQPGETLNLGFNIRHTVGKPLGRNGNWEYYINMQLDDITPEVASRITNDGLEPLNFTPEEQEAWNSALPETHTVRPRAGRYNGVSNIGEGPYTAPGVRKRRMELEQEAPNVQPVQ